MSRKCHSFEAPKHSLFEAPKEGEMMNKYYITEQAPHMKPIMKKRLFKYTENFTTKNEFSDKKFDIFHISAQNIDCGYMSEPPRWGGSNEYQQSMF